jgi:hypothetical protein
VSAGSARLERTRLAILEHVHRKEQRKHGVRPDNADTPAEARAAEQGPRQRGRGPSSWMGQARDLIDGWWRYHPAHMALDFARPSLASYAQRKPVQYLGIAAAAGAALFLLRPWKLISVTGLLVALVKSPQVASLVMSAMASSQNPRDDEPEATEP